MENTKLEFNIENTKDNLTVLRINKNNKWIYMGSKYNMTLEIDKFLEQCECIDKKESILLVYGFGTGEHLKSLRKKYKDNEIVVFEPNISMNEYIDNIEWIKKDDKITVICGKISDFINNINVRLDGLNLDFTKILFFSNYQKVYVEEVKEFLEELKYFFINVKLDNSTKINMSKIWFKTLMENLKYIIDGIPINKYRNIYKDKPAIIVSAGPSLEKNIDELRKINDEILIISGGRTLRSLIDRKINPHLLAVVDPLEVSYELCKDYIEELNIPLLFYEGTNHKVVSEHKGEKVFFSYNEFINKILGEKVLEVQTGGSVAHVMTSVAIIMGCNPIIFVGQDLAYTNEKSHAVIAQNRDGKTGFNELKRNDDIFVEDINGNLVRTSLVLNDYRMGLEKIIEKSKKTTFINATEGGARIKGTIELTLKEAIDKYKNGRIKLLNDFKKVENSFSIKTKALIHLKETKYSCIKIIKEYKKSIEYLNELYRINEKRDNAKINLIINKLDKIDKKVSEEYKKIELVDKLIYPIIYETMQIKKCISNSKDDKCEQNILYENMRFYLSIIEELQYALKYIDDVIDKLSK